MKASQPPLIQEAVSHILTSHPPLVASTTASQMPETEVVEKPIQSVVTTDLEHVSADSGNLPINTSTPARDQPLPSVGFQS